MTKEEAINTLNSLKQYYNDKNEDSYVGFDNEDNEALDLAIKALEQQPCEDCISREALMKLFKEYQPSLAVHVCEFGDALEELPSVKPQLNKS